LISARLIEAEVLLFAVVSSVVNREIPSPRTLFQLQARLHLRFYRNKLFATSARAQTKVEVPRIRVGKKQEIETLINEEALLPGMCLRNEKKDWIPRIGIATQENP
jgi:hypothetical protein